MLIHAGVLGDVMMLASQWQVSRSSAVLVSDTCFVRRAPLWTNDCFKLYIHKMRTLACKGVI